MDKINNILFITLSNIGDAVLTLPALDYLIARFPKSRITVLVPNRPKEIFENNPRVNRLIVFDKYSRFRDKLKLFLELRKNKFDLVIDLRNSFFGVFLPCKYRIPVFLNIPPGIRHMKDRHIYKVNSALSRAGFSDDRPSAGQSSLQPGPVDRKYIQDILGSNKISNDEKLIIVSPGARSHIKQWDKDGFVKLISMLNRGFGRKVILVGDKNDVPLSGYISGKPYSGVVDLTGKTSILGLSYLLERASLLITNDSAVMHLGSYKNIPVLSMFGPTDEAKYGPWSGKSMVLKKEIFCRPCEKAQCRFNSLKCLSLIKPEEVYKMSQAMLLDTPQEIPKKSYKRILISRTDRIGDVLLSTPAIKIMRDNYPDSYIAMMVSPYAQDIVKGNPYLDEVIVYDKDKLHHSWLNSFRFGLALRKKKFDLAVILHPTNRVHLVSFISGITRRVGYDRKFGFLLTDQLKHVKQEGKKPELEYNLDLLDYLGIGYKDKELFMPIDPGSQERIKDLLRESGIKEGDKLLIINPGATCPSRIWPKERFAATANNLIKKYDLKTVVIGGKNDRMIAQGVVDLIDGVKASLAGRTSVSEMASLLKRSCLLISNDSGPVHIANALGVAVISIFSRNQAGLSPRRWGPRGENARVLHKNVGCSECLAHNCQKGFACLMAITVEEVVAAADSLLSQ